VVEIVLTDQQKCEHFILFSKINAFYFSSYVVYSHFDNKICILIGFVCDFIDFLCEFTVKTTEHRLPASTAVISHENF
jgi:hypothetical protein